MPTRKAHNYYISNLLNRKVKKMEQLSQLAVNALTAGNYQMAIALYESIAKMESLQSEALLQKQLISELEDQVAMQNAFIDQIQAVVLE